MPWRGPVTLGTHAFSPEGAPVPGATTRLQHDGIFYDDESDFVETVVPFIRDGV